MGFNTAFQVGSNTPAVPGSVAATADDPAAIRTCDPGLTLSIRSIGDVDQQSITSIDSGVDVPLPPV
jgi:hypothetical protein